MLSFIFGLLAGASAWPVASRYLDAWRSSSRSLADEVQWALRPTGDLIYNKDGSFLASWELRGPDLTFSSAEAADALAAQAQRLLDALDGSYMLHVDSVRLPSTAYASGDGDAPAPARLCDRVREAAYAGGRHYENRVYLSVTHSLPREKYRRAAKLFYTGGAPDMIDWEGEIEDLEVQLASLIDLLPSVLHARRLRGPALAGYLRGCMTGDFAPVAAGPPGREATLDVLFAEPLLGGFEPKVGHRWVRVVSLQGYPDAAFMGVLGALDALPFAYRYSTRLIGVSTPDATNFLKKRRSSWIARSFSPREAMSSGDREQSETAKEALSDKHAQNQALDVGRAKEEVDSGEVSMVHHTGVVVVMHEDLAVCNDRARRVEKALRSAGSGFVARREEGLATAALIGSWPGHGHHNVRRYPLLTDYAVRLLPLTATYPGPETTPCSMYPPASPPLFYAATEEQTPFRYTPFGESGDVGHQIVVGPTGTGKSILLGYQAMRQSHFPGGQSVLLDNGYSFAPLCEAMNGVHHDVGANGAFQPLAGIGDPEERRWVGSWVEATARLRGAQLTPSKINKIYDTLDLVAQRDPYYWTLQELHAQIQDEEIKTALQPFAGEGALGMLLNAQSDAFRAAPFQVVELGKLLRLDPSIYTPVLLYLFHRIGSTLAPDRSTSVDADEFFLFAARTEEGRDFVMEAFRTYRKMNARMSVATQDPADLTGSTDGAGPLSAALGSARSLIFLPNPEATSPAQRAGYEALGLSPNEIALIAEATPKREYISKQPAGTRKWNLRLGPELAFLTAADGLSLQGTAEKMRSFKAEYGPAWVAEWLRFRGMGTHAALAEKVFTEKPASNGAHSEAPSRAAPPPSQSPLNTMPVRTRLP